MLPGAPPPCPSPHDVPSGATLAQLGVTYLGSANYAVAIALATNQRTGEGFLYIADPDNLIGIQRVCIPSKSEADDLEKSWTAYDRAVSVARLPRRADARNDLVTIPANRPVNVVAWVRKDQADRLKTPAGTWATTTAADTWITVEPHLQDFCRTFERDPKASPDALTRRLEQRLGLAPASSKAFFVRMTLQNPGPFTIFRPCSAPATEAASCTTGPPSNSTAPYQQWFTQQYYSSFGQSLFSEFPWTALGYTFDWAPGPNGGFQRIGESEFVIYRNSPITIWEVLPTEDYCAPAR